MKKRLIIPIFAVLFIFGFCLALSFQTNQNLDSVSDSITYNSNVCKQVIRADGTAEPVECSHNLLYDSGKNMVRLYLSDTGSTDEIDWIELGNATLASAEPQADNLEDYTASASCGLEKTAGSYVAYGTGNYSISNTFTSTCDDVLTNVTRLLNDADDIFAGNSFTLVHLYTDDTVLVNWSISIT